MDKKSEYGLQVFSEIMGPDRAKKMAESAGSGGFGSDIGKLAVEYCFADVWGREGLERKQRSLIVIAILIATRQPSELANHVRIGARNGLTVKEFEEILIQCIPYLGFPAVATATSVVIETLRELGMETTTKTSEERGLL